MKMQNLLQKFIALSKRKKRISLFVLAIFFFVSCVPPADLPAPVENNRIENLDTTSTATMEPAATRTTAPTATPLPPTSTTAPTETPSPAPTPTQISLPACIPAGSKVEAATVVEIIDGDTITVETNGERLPVRYIGIDTAERGSDFYEEASDRNRELVLGKDVLLVKDVSETDSFARQLRYVFVDGQFVNEILVEEGYAVAKDYPPDTACSLEFAAAQTEASTRGTGIWVVAPTEVVVATATVAATQSLEASTSACPTGCVEEIPGCSIKGNINREGEKIYHVPSGKFYSRTQINPSNGERWFCTAEEAKANGWRASME